MRTLNPLPPPWDARYFSPVSRPDAVAAAAAAAEMYRNAMNVQPWVWRPVMP